MVLVGEADREIELVDEVAKPDEREPAATRQAEKRWVQLIDRLSSVRLKIEQGQLILGVEWFWLRSIGLQGA